MKKFLLKVVPYLAFCLVIMVLVPIFVDPYNVFHWKNARNNGVEPNKNYIKMNYILDNSTKYDAYMFGSSRVGSIHTEKLEGVNCYNMTYSMGVPAEALANLKTMVDNGIIPKKIYLGVDDMSYTLDPDVNKSEAARASYEYLKADVQHFADDYLNIMTTVKSLSIITSGEKAPGVAEIYEYGWWADYDYESTYDWSKETPSIGQISRIDETISEIQEMKKICDENGIDFIVFTNPMTDMTYKAAMNFGYQEFLDKLGLVTDYYDLSYLNGNETDHSNFIDNSHYDAYLGDKIIEVLNGMED